MDYSALYERLVNRAVAAGGVDLDTFIEDAIASGMSFEALQQSLLDDLESAGPIFGKVQKSLEGAAANAVAEAQRQGEWLAQSEEFLKSLDDFDDSDEAIDALLDNPQAIDQLEQETSDLIFFTWVAELVNTCHRCLPLHGTTMRADEWRERGLDPSTIHAGWNSVCHCKKVRADKADVPELRAPLTRKKVHVPSGKPISRKTMRAVSQIDVDKATAARDKAMDSLEGRRTLRQAGKVLANGEANKN